ncbi:DUF5025 domain-containing protein [Winogradskyella schleiferi]|uniref:DUF5025 domain-containing protein n=1 Tax=Winogradskyella schleiferi TaxID=2686078 RepID=UPI0015BF7993|nr:DUF5025 domain-containing protein [Winogradskyella schleiferi]
MLKKITPLYLIVLCFSFCYNCSSDSDSNDDETDSNEYIYFMSGKIDGESFIYGQKTSATELDYTSGLSVTLPAVCAYNPDTGGFNYSPFVYPNFDDESRPTMGIDFVRFHLCTDDSSQLETFNDKFPTTSYEFADSDLASSGLVGKIGLTYSPNAQDGPYYSTYGGDQSNSTFEITSSTAFNTYFADTLISAGQIVEGNFSATFYNSEDPSDIIVITDGQFKMIPSLD